MCNQRFSSTFVCDEGIICKYRPQRTTGEQQNSEAEAKTHITDFYQFVPRTDIKPAGQQAVDFLWLLKL